LRAGKLSFNDSYCIFHQGELFVKSLHISEYAFGTYINHEPLQERKLLMNKKELKKLETKIQEKGYSIIPIRIFFSEKGLAKIEIGLGKGKKHFDKRNTIKERESDREIKRKYGV
jgi:SsrA-binding protein